MEQSMVEMITEAHTSMTDVLSLPTNGLHKNLER